MAKTSKAVICRQLNEPVVVEEVEVESPRQDEVMLRVLACGVCHSDLSAINGTLAIPPPVVLGHEASAVVEEVGEGVTDIAVGETAIVSWIAMCGKCRYCTMGRPALCEVADRALLTLPDGTRRLRDANGDELNHFAGVAVMAEYATLHRDNVVVIDADIPATGAALVGCAVMTGVGAVLNTARVEAGSSVAVFGTGGIGLNVIQGATLAGAETIIAIDVKDQKLEFAKTFGATHTVNPNLDDAVKKVREITGGGADYAFECIGLGTTIAQAYKAVRKGGTAVVVGVAKPKDSVRLNAFSIPFLEKSLVGSMYGSARPREDFPRLLGWYRDKRLKLDELVTQTYTIDDAPRAFEDLETGVNARGVIVFS